MIYPGWEWECSMRKLLSVAAMMGILSGIGILQDARAATISIFEDAATVPTTATNPVADVTIGTINYGVTGSTPNVFRSPFETPAGAPIIPQFSTLGYTSIQAGGAGTWNTASTNSISLFWGSPDTYNSIGFWSEANGTGSFLGSITGGDLAAFASSPGRGHALVTLFLSEAFNSVVLSSGSNAFEFTNLTLSQIPIPAALPLFATGLAALALVKWRRKRKGEAVAA